MIPVDLHDLGCDFYATSGHKWLMGPKGTGMLYVNKPMLPRWRRGYAGAYADKVFDLDAGRFERLPAARSVEIGTRSASLIADTGAAIDFLERGRPGSVAAGRARTRPSITDEGCSR
jgi:selenocysteine lyase/cysteine desulfurase